MEVLSPADASGGGGGGRRSSDCSSPEFEFWMVRNPTLPQPKLLSADELFVDGVILPLHLVHQPTSEPTHSRCGDKPEAGAQPLAAHSTSAAEPAAPASSSCSPIPASSTSTPVGSSAAPAPSTSKRWRDIFKVAGGEKRGEEKERRRERKNSAGGVAELNINIWPFSRSRSAGNGGSRPKGGATSAASGRRVSSAPCSRSNSRGESSKPAVASPPPGALLAGNTGRRWASSPGRAGLGAGGGIHVGRASPVWQARRGGRKGKDGSAGGNIAGTGGNTNAGGGRKGGWGGGAVRVNLNVNTCIGYGQQLNCRAEDKDGVGGAGGRAVPASGSSHGTGSHFISLRAFFSKKVAVNASLLGRGIFGDT